MWRALVHPDMLVGSSLTRRLVVVAEDLRSLDRPIPQAELAARTGCHRATPGRLAVRYLGGIIERDRPGAGHAWTWIPDPDLSADDCRRPVGYVPLAAVDATYAELIGLEPTTDIEATTAMARSVGARYDGRLRLGAAVGGLARDAGLSRRAYRAAEGRLVEKGYLTRTGRRGVWNGRLAHPDGVLGAALRQHWQAATRRWARRARPAVCGRFGALRRWDPFTRSIGSRAGRPRPLYTQCEPAANTPKRRMEGPEPGPRTPEAAKSATERGPPRPGGGGLRPREQHRSGLPKVAGSPVASRLARTRPRRRVAHRPVDRSRGGKGRFVGCGPPDPHRTPSGPLDGRYDRRVGVLLRRRTGRPPVPVAWRSSLRTRRPGR